NALISATLPSVGTGSSFCRPSRGPTSRRLTRSGRSLMSLSWPVGRPLLIERRDALAPIPAEGGRPPRGVLDVETGREGGIQAEPHRPFGVAYAHRRVARDGGGDLQRFRAGFASRHQAVGQP